jgi:hypothetical protein
MAKLLFKLNSVPDDEADDIRALLEQADIEFYETTSGNWGFGFAAIWLNNEDNLDQAQTLVQQYQQQRQENAKQNQQAAVEQGLQFGLWQALKLSPIKITLVIIFVGLLAYFSTVPFLTGSIFS